ncbi:MAG: RNase J family beta-CASP ribonuclease [Dehalococcoidia bacterium]|nr:RNase J family beta-CASP ribonuclease [Dehalococcoidia bacterium]
MAEKLRVIPLGGLGEIGKNMMLLEYGEDMIAIDAGLMFPQEEMLGIDLVIPDVSYIEERRHKFKAIFITHGHEDHTGGLPYVLRRVQAPIYCTPLTNGLISVKLKEHKLLDSTDLRTILPGESVQIGVFRVQPFSVAHSVPDSVGFAIRTPVGIVIHTGDFKLDHTPVMGQLTDLSRLAELGKEGVLLLLADSTYAEVPGYTPSERVVGEALGQIMHTSPGRVIVATFASLISRVQQVVDGAAATNRKVFVTGRSMMDNVQMARDRGYLSFPREMTLNVNDLKNTPPEQVVIITTGSQGEPTSALTRMANGDHQHVQVIPGDTVVLSASPIPGNESSVSRTIDNLFRLGARVLYNRIADVHVRGHAAQEELKIVQALVKPKFFVPVHGEYRHMVLHAQLAQQMGVAKDNAMVLVDGDVLELDGESAVVHQQAVQADYVYVDGLGVGDVDHIVLRDRQHLATDGMVAVILALDKQTGRIIGRPDVVSRGVTSIEESDELLERTKDVVVASMEGADHIVEWAMVNQTVKEAVANFLYREVHRRPMILPVAFEV